MKFLVGLLILINQCLGASSVDAVGEEKTITFIKVINTKTNQVVKVSESLNTPESERIVSRFVPNRNTVIYFDEEWECAWLLYLLMSLHEKHELNKECVLIEQRTHMLPKRFRHE